MLPPRRRTLYLAIAAALVCVVAYAVYWLVKSRRPIEWAGTVESRTIEVGSRTGGRVAAVLVREGDSVKAGQPLVILEAGDLEAQRLVASGQLAQAEAELARLARGRGARTARQAAIAAAQARLAEAEATADRSRFEARRAQRLFEGGAGSRANAEDTAANARAAEASAVSLRATVSELATGTGEDIAAAQGAVETARGRLQQVEVAIDELTIRAPRPARVEALDLRPGDLLAPSGPALTLFEPDQRFVRIWVPETQLGRVRVGQQLPIYVDSFPRRAFTGVVEHIDRVGQFTPRNLQTVDERAHQLFAARVTVRDDQDLLRAGMAAFARLPRR
jgi:HlyD family secretion protein